MKVLLVDANGMKKEWTKDVLDYMISELKIDPLFVIAGEYAELDEYQSCELILQRDCRRADYDSYYKKYVKSYWALDETVLNEFAQYMPEVMSMMSREEDVHLAMIDPSYDGRYRYMMKNLRFWYAFFMEQKIDYVLFSFSPHVGFDYLIYNLCKVMQIKTVCVFDDFLHVKRHFVARNFEQFDSIFKSAQDEVNQLISNGENLQLAKELQDELDMLSSQNHKEMKAAIGKFARTTTLALFRLYYGYYSVWDYICCEFRDFYSMYIKDYSKPLALIKTVKNAVPAIFVNYKRQHIKLGKDVYKRTEKLHKEYKKMAVEADFTQKYVYVAFHYIPEDTSSPKGGRLYADQSVIIGIIAASIPDDWKVYVKMHPGQLGVVCCKEMFEDILEIPKVVLVDTSTNTLELTQHAQAVATLTGHNAWEAQFMSRPALVFGITDLRYAPMSYYVRTLEDCKNAIEDIINNPKTTNKEEIRRFLLAHDRYTFYFEKERVVEEIRKVMNSYN